MSLAQAASDPTQLHLEREATDQIHLIEWSQPEGD